MRQKEFTLQRLKEAFVRLKTGKPERTKADGKISILRINEEAGLSRGAIYYYKAFVQEVKGELPILEVERNKKQAINNLQENLSSELKLRRDRDKEKRLKTEYRIQAGNFKQLTDEVVKANVSLTFRCMELEEALSRIEAGKVVPIK